MIQVASNFFTLDNKLDELNKFGAPTISAIGTPAKASTTMMASSGNKSSHSG